MPRAPSREDERQSKGKRAGRPDEWMKKGHQYKLMKAGKPKLWVGKDENATIAHKSMPLK